MLEIVKKCLIYTIILIVTVLLFGGSMKIKNIFNKSTTSNIVSEPNNNDVQQQKSSTSNTVSDSDSDRLSSQFLKSSIIKPKKNLLHFPNDIDLFTIFWNDKRKSRYIIQNVYQEFKRYQEMQQRKINNCVQIQEKKIIQKDTACKHLLNLVDNYFLLDNQEVSEKRTVGNWVLTKEQIVQIFSNLDFIESDTLSTQPDRFKLSYTGRDLNKQNLSGQGLSPNVGKKSLGFDYPIKITKQNIIDSEIFCTKALKDEKFQKLFNDACASGQQCHEYWQIRKEYIKDITIVKPEEIVVVDTTPVDITPAPTSTGWKVDDNIDHLRLLFSIDSSGSMFKDKDDCSFNKSLKTVCQTIADVLIKKFVDKEISKIVDCSDKNNNNNTLEIHLQFWGAEDQFYTIDNIVEIANMQILAMQQTYQKDSEQDFQKEKLIDYLYKYLLNDRTLQNLPTDSWGTSLQFGLKEARNQVKDFQNKLNKIESDGDKIQTKKIQLFYLTDADSQSINHNDFEEIEKEKNEQLNKIEDFQFNVVHLLKKISGNSNMIKVLDILKDLTKEKNGVYKTFEIEKSLDNNGNTQVTWLEQQQV